MIFCGQGISNLPDIRNDREEWYEYGIGRVFDTNKILTTEYFEQNPQAIWNMFYDLSGKLSKAAPNSTNKAIFVKRFFVNIHIEFLRILC